MRDKEPLRRGGDASRLCSERVSRVGQTASPNLGELPRGHPFASQVNPYPPTTDTRPYRGRGAIAYAGCMTVARAAAIDSAYSSGPSHRCGLWVGRPTFQIDEHLVQLLLEAGHGLVQGGARCSRCSNRALGLLVAPAARCSDSGAGCTPCSRGGRPLDSRFRGNDGGMGLRGSCLRRNDGRERGATGFPLSRE